VFDINYIPGHRRRFGADVLCVESPGAHPKDMDHDIDHNLCRDKHLYVLDSDIKSPLTL